MVFDAHRNLEWARTSLSTLLLPIAYTIAWPSKLFHRLSDTLVTHKTLLKENTQLRSEHFLLASQLQRLNMLEEENTQLRALLRAAPQIRSSKVLAAQQLAASADPFTHEVMLDVGKNQGVFPGQAIVDAQGIMGQITQVNPLTSRGLLITDTRSAIPVQNARTGQRAILVGSGLDETLSLKHIPETANIQIGDRLICSGLGGYFPPGYPVGIVNAISKKKGEDFTTVTVHPCAHLSHQQVLLIWPEQKIELKAPTEIKKPVGSHR